MGTLKANIQQEVYLWDPKSLNNAFKVARNVESKIMATIRIQTNTYKEGNVSTSIMQPTRLKPQRLEEIREKGLCYNCDNKYNKGHKCSVKKLFYIDCEKEEEYELEPSQGLEETTTPVSCHALLGINTPQTLEREGFIKNKKEQYW